MNRNEAEALYRQIPETPTDEFYLLEPEFCQLLYYQIPAQQRPPWATAFLTIVNWFAMSQRNGVWTFYEAAPVRDIAATLDYLNQTGDKELASVLQSGVRDYQNPKYAGNWNYPEEWIADAGEIDSWIARHEVWLYQWEQKLLMQNKDLMLRYLQD